MPKLLTKLKNINLTNLTVKLYMNCMDDDYMYKIFYKSYTVISLSFYNSHITLLYMKTKWFDEKLTSL